MLRPCCCASSMLIQSIFHQKAFQNPPRCFLANKILGRSQTGISATSLKQHTLTIEVLVKSVQALTFFRNPFWFEWYVSDPQTIASTGTKNPANNVLLNPPPPLLLLLSIPACLIPGMAIPGIGSMTFHQTKQRNAARLNAKSNFR